jgi:pimeloyl-ACP methyl ester carboxylesterase
VHLYRTFLLHEMLPLIRGEFASTRLDVPTRLIIGEKDSVGQGVDRSFEPYAEDMTLEWVPGAGHFLPEEKPALVLERALAFFSD